MKTSRSVIKKYSNYNKCTSVSFKVVTNSTGNLEIWKVQVSHFLVSGRL